MKLSERYQHRHRSVVEVLRWLDCDHLPSHLREVGQVITDAAERLMCALEDGQQLTRGLHALVEAKDCFVRQRVLDTERDRMDTQ